MSEMEVAQAAGASVISSAEAGMTVADWALVVSLASAALSLFSLAWNIWSKWVHPKPRIKVGFSVMLLIYESGASPKFLSAFATNFGPTDTTLKQLIARYRLPGWWYKWGQARRWQYGIMNTARTPQDAVDEVGPQFGFQPVKLAVGDETSAYLVFRHQHLRDDGIVDVGFVDVFGRYHWAPRKSVKKVVASIREAWPA